MAVFKENKDFEPQLQVRLRGYQDYQDNPEAPEPQTQQKAASLEQF